MIKRVFSIIILIFVLFIQAGCNKASTPRDALVSFVRNMNACKYKIAFDYVDNRGGFKFHDGADKIINSVSRSLDAVITDDVTGVSSATLTVKVTSVDLREIYASANETVCAGFYDVAVNGGKITTVEYNRRMVDEIVMQAGSSSAPAVTTECTVQLYNNNGAWLIRMDQLFYAAVTGYLDEANSRFLSGALSGEEETTMTTLPPEEMVVTDSDPLID